MNPRFMPAVLIAAAVLVFTGCSSTGTKDDSGASVESRDGSGATTSGARVGGAWTGNPLENPDSQLYTKVIYFEFDQSTIRSEFVDVLRAHAGYLVSNRSPAY
jgi:peptidoglycan-associated lipoprotein